MINKKQTFKGIILLLLTTLLFISLLTGISFGAYNISIIDILSFKVSQLDWIVLTEIRAPRVLLAGFVGAALSISGASLQGLFRNPLAEPGLIGVSSGAALGAATSIVFGSHIFNEAIDIFMIPLSAIIGSILVIMILILITNKFGMNSITYILLAGIAINAFAGVGIGILTYISDDSELRGLTFWSMGSFGGANWKIIFPSICLIMITIIWKIRFSRKLDILQLGEREAYRIGINVKKLKINIIITSAIIIGAGVSLSGMIGFVGLVIPHIIRLLGIVKHKMLLITSALGGSILMIISDLICRTMIQPAELPVGLITSAIGAPFFLWLIFKMKNDEYYR